MAWFDAALVLGQQPTMQSQQPFGGTSQQPFGGTSQQPFGATSQQPFGGTPQQPFGGTSQQAFGGTPQQAFGGTPQQAFGSTSQQAFGGASQQPFGGTSQQPFGGTSQQPFGGTSQQAFGGTSQQPFGGTSQHSFAGPTLQQQQGTFGQDTFGSAFGQDAFQGSNPKQGAFGQDPFGQAFGMPSMPSTVQQGMFGGQAQGAQQGLFGAPSNPAQQGLFGAPSNSAQQGLFGAPSNPNQQGLLFGAPSNSNQQGLLFGAPSNSAQQGLFGAPSNSAQQGLFGGQGTVQQPLGTKDPESATFPELFEAKDTIYACTSDENRVVYVGDASGNLYAKSARDFASTPMENRVPHHSDKDCIGVTSLKSLGQGKLLVATAAKLAFIWDVNQNRMLGLGETGQALARHASPFLVFAGSWDKTVKCRDLRVSKDSWVFTLPGKCHALDVLQDRLLYVAANTPNDSVVCVYDTRKPSESLRKVKCASPVRTLCVSQSRAFWGTDNGDLTQTGHSDASLNNTRNINSEPGLRAVINQVDFSPSDEKVFVGTTQGKLVTVDKAFKIRPYSKLVSSAPLTAVSTSSDIVVCKSYNYYDGGQAMRQGTAYKHNQVLVFRKPS